MARADAPLIHRMLRSVYRSLVAFGSLWALMPAPGPGGPADRPEAGERLGGEEGPAVPGRYGAMPHGHPERLCPDVALTETERALERQLRGLV